MSLLQSVLAGVPGLVLGGLAGVYVGRRLRGRATLAWTAGAALLLAGVAISATGNIYDIEWLTYSGVGWMAGAITGIRHGYKPLLGEAPGTSPSESRAESDEP